MEKKQRVPLWFVPHTKLLAMNIYMLTFSVNFAQYWVATCFDFLDSFSLFYYFSCYIIWVGGRWIEAKKSL